MSEKENRNYVACWYDWGTDKVIVLERDQHGSLFKKKYNAPYYFYIPDDEGKYESIFGHKLFKAEFSSRDEYEEAKKHFPVRFESDFRPVHRILMDEYYDRPAPVVNFAFLDIEVNYSKKIGFAGPTNAYAEINAVTIYQSWTKKYLTYVIPPKVDGVEWLNISGNTVDTIYAEINKLISEGSLRAGIIPEIILCRDEYELVNHMLDAIQDADIISGWNSEFFDIPYICERILRLGGESLLARMEHVGVRPPKREMVNRYGTDEPIYKFLGRSHLDYMRLFQKFTFEGRTSYALGNILQEEVGIGKLEYAGSLEELYHKDFATFTAYNFRDVDGLVQLDDKFKFIALANQMAHESTVVFDAVLGTVSYVETAITNHAHYKMQKIVHDKSIGEHDKVEGAIVLNPKIGLHEWIGSVDINSLYPNTIRSLNISPEKIVGQFTAKEDAWESIYKQKEDSRLCCIFEDGSQEIASASEWQAVLKENKWAVSAYGTIFDQSSGRGVVSDILGYWYSERKRLQAEKKKYGKLAKEETDQKKKDEYKRLEEHYDLLQLTKKISMNSLYGALLNVAFRFGDERMGASVTASGRQITTHMIETISEIITGTRAPLVKTTTMVKGLPSHSYTIDSEAIIYGDTDSCYYKCIGATDRSTAIEIADLAAEGVNSTFPSFMRRAFNCQEEFDGLIKAGREIVGRRGIFQAKKKYMIKVIDLEGVEVQKMKSMGSEIKKADTPKVIQQFLKETVDRILDGREYLEIAEFVNLKRREIIKGNAVNVFNIGVAKQTNNVEKFLAEYMNPGTMKSANGNKLTIPGHVRAALNYNHLLSIYDKGQKEIRSGDKVLVFYLKKNDYDYESIAFPAESTKFPKWFEEHFSVDKKKTEERMFDSKLEGIFSALGKEVPSPQTMLNQSILEF